MEINYMMHSQVAKSGPVAGKDVSPAFVRAGRGNRTDDVFVHAAIQEADISGHIVMRQVTPAVRISAAEWDKRPKGKFGAELPSTGPWVIEKIGVSEWFE